MAEQRHIPVRHRQNVDGPFYAVNGDCMSCGAPEMHSPSLMSHDSTGHCFFTRQPETTEETDGAVVSVWASCCGAVRYGGKDSEILNRLAEMGLAEQCDFRLEHEPKCAPRRRVSFEFVEIGKAKVGARKLTNYVAEFLMKPRHDHTRVSRVRFSKTGASFDYEWRSGSPSEYCRVTFDVEQRPEEYCWTIAISRKDRYSTTAFAIWTHEALVRDQRFRSIRWFSDEEWERGAMAGHSLPY